MKRSIVEISRPTAEGAMLGAVLTMVAVYAACGFVFSALIDRTKEKGKK